MAAWNPHKPAADDPYSSISRRRGTRGRMLASGLPAVKERRSETGRPGELGPPEASESAGGGRVNLHLGLFFCHGLHENPPVSGGESAAAVDEVGRVREPAVDALEIGVMPVVVVDGIEDVLRRPIIEG